MAEKYSKKMKVWEEIYLSSPSLEEKQENLTLAQVKKQIDSPPPESEMENLKEYLRSLISPSLLETGFQAELFLSSDLLGNIRLKTGSFSDSIYPLYANSLDSEKEILALLEDILQFYSHSFVNDPELLEWITPILLKLNRITDLIQLLNQFHKRNVLPLKHQIFFILVGVYENTLQNLVFSGEETKLLNILYKYKFVGLSKLEKNRLYDMVISRENMDLIGIIFHLFSDVHHGIRNIYPIYEVIKKNFELLENSERREFLESYKETGRYLEIFFLMKKAYSKKEIKNYIQKMKLINGKNISNSQINFSNSNQESILLKYEQQKDKQESYTFSPFELLVLFNTNFSQKLKQEILSAYQKISYSYIVNRAMAVLSYYEKDFRNFLFYLGKSGSLQHHAECVYLKAIALAEIGEKQDALLLLYRLQQIFPSEEIIETAIQDINQA